MRTVVLVHGSWHGAWCWAEVLAGLDERAVPTVAVDLPSIDLHGDADEVRNALDRLGDERALLVGHSYGGAVITDAGDHPAVDRLVYITGFVPDEGETVLSIGVPGELGPDLARAIQINDDGTSALDAELAVPAFYADCAPVDTERTLSLLRPQGLGCSVQAPRAVAWRSKPATYVVCGADRGLPPEFQRNMAGRIPDVALVEWPESSHSPFLSMPAAVVDLLTGLAGDDS